MANATLATGDRRFVLHFFDDYLSVSQYNLKGELFGQSLILQRTNRKLVVALEDSADFSFEHGRFLPFYCIFGIFHLLKGPYLAIVTKVSKIDQLNQPDKVIYQIQQIQLILLTSPTSKPPQLTPQQLQDEQKYLSMLHKMIATKSFYFAYDFDLTHTLQRISKLNNNQDTIAERADRRFCWNYPSCSLFLEKQLYGWVVPIMQAYVEIVENCNINNDYFTLMYISRRSCFRQGTRFTMRGIDNQGNVTNFVETEQALLFSSGKQTSFVQIRGSIPVYWSSPVSMKYAPKVYQWNSVKKNVNAFLLHVEETFNLYGRVLMINLIDKKKEQLQLGNLFQNTVAEATRKDTHVAAKIRFEWFDFHHECRKMRWNNLEKLVHQVDDDFLDYGFFSVDENQNILSMQSGILRVNCMDNLDRTNVVQSLFARRSLLVQLGLVDDLRGNVLESNYPEFEKVFKNVWGNNADAISMLYAGTGALKTDFTRTGKRTKRGALEDGYNSCLRYILNNFFDGRRQDAIDLLLLRYIPKLDSKNSPFLSVSQSDSMESIGVKALALYCVIFLMNSYYAPLGVSSMSLMWKSACYFFLVAVLGILFLIKKGHSLGSCFVCRPVFCPQFGCATTWKTQPHEHVD